MKQVRSARDLAVNGAPPAFDEPLHVGRPNLGDRARFLEMAARVHDSHCVANNGPLVRELERRIARELAVEDCVATCNGTIALEIAIRALGLSGEVIVPSYTFVATAHALHWQGITPVFADIDPATHNLDPDSVRRAITPRTTGIIGVHLWGRAAPVESLQAIADAHGLQLMFDAAHAFGCSHGGRMIGGFGRAEALSFHATKAFTTFEGGAVVTNDSRLAATLRLMRNFGFSGYDNVIHPGTNGKMTEICAAMGLVNLDALGEVVRANRSQHEVYRQALAGIPGVSLLGYDDREHANHHYAVLELDDARAALRDELVRVLHAENILARRYFWPGCHRMLPYRELFPEAGRSLPQTERVASRVVVLPNGPSVPPGTAELVAQLVRLVLERG